ncbi:hypothetical protein MUS1_07020 [Marinomonas ushuaiensis DSM 15871]|uniref:Chromosome partition protein Smc n=1 Tax=Marinomonas ushuaiensis DSM 15871 TaxID=1122207 RepID=X7E7N6_9GAMM|nr:hypothetical protein [Marinomonas ushuaiensis]ETX11932.1 hypothetical protein MUS1_07020 [Marinomonas ushuaiensis DSM 15871]
MKASTKILVPFTLSLLVSACSTSSQQQSDSAISPESVVLSQATTSSLPSVSVEDNRVLIESLEQQIADNQSQLSSLNRSLDEKDATIAALQASSSNADTLRELEAQKQSREELEIQFSALNLDNDLLKHRINELENENLVLEEENADLELDNENAQKQLAELRKQNQTLGASLAEIRAEHQILSKNYQSLNNAVLSIQSSDSDTSDNTRHIQTAVELSSLQAQVEEQREEIEEYKNEILELESSLDESAHYESRWKALDEKLAVAQQRNTQLAEQLKAAEVAMSSSLTERDILLSRLNNVQQALNVKENSGISITAAMEALQAQMSSRLLDVRWQLPSEMALHDTFEIVVTARAQPSLSGQAYLAELVTDSSIQMISDSVANAVVQSGGLQWRWRVAGLNEKTDAQLNLIVNQQINIQDQAIMRQVYRGSETLSLVNTNLFEKYGYWAGAILLGLLGGFGIGRLNSRKKNEL